MSLLSQADVEQIYARVALVQGVEVPGCYADAQALLMLVEEDIPRLLYCYGRLQAQVIMLEDLVVFEMTGGDPWSTE